MRGAVWRGAGDIRVSDVADPENPRGDDVLLKVKWAGICGTDLHEFLAGPIFIPQSVDEVVLGHEFSAEVVAVGVDVRSFRPGDRVGVVPHRFCGTCHFCRRQMFQHCLNLELVGITRNGAFAPYTVVRENQLVRLPDGVSDIAAAMLEPLAVGLRIMQLPGVRPGQRAAIVGAGPIGLCALLTSRACGITDVVVVERNVGRAALARELGATTVIDPTATDPINALLDATDGYGVDLTIECVGLVETMNLAIDAVRPGGVAVLLGISEAEGEIELGRASSHGKEVRGCIGYFEGEFEAVSALLDSGRLDPAPLISRQVDLENIVEDGFRKLVDEKDTNVKVLVRP